MTTTQALASAALAITLSPAFAQSATAQGGHANADQQHCLMTAAKSSFGRDAYHMRTIGTKEVFSIPVTSTTQYGNGFLNLQRKSTVNETLVVNTIEGSLSFFPANPYEVNATTLKDQWIEFTGKNHAIAYAPTLKIGSGESPWVDSFTDEVRRCARIGMKH